MDWSGRRGPRSNRHGRLRLIDRVRDKHSGHGVFLSAQERKVKLPQILEPRRRMQHLHHLRLAALASAVIHDGDTRMKRVHQHLRIRRVLSVVQTQQHIDGAKPVIGTHQLEFLVLGQISQMHRAKFPERNVDPDRLRVLGVVVARLEIGAIRIRLARAGKRRLNRLARRGDDAHIETRHRNPVAGFDDSVLCLGVERRVRLRQKRVGSFARLDVGAVIDELANLDLRSQLGHAAEMIAVPMRRDQMIDLLNAGVFHRIENAICVANRPRAVIAGIDQQRLARRRNDQRGVAALDIDDINVERLRL